MLIVYLGVGSNIEPESHIIKTKQLLQTTYQSVRFSRTFESQAVGFDGDNFFNLVAEIETKETLDELICSLKILEETLGRIRGKEKFSSRHIDIDILLYGDWVCQQPIVLPRDEIRHNAYVLCPLAELAPTLLEPGGTLTYAQLWDQFDQAAEPLIFIDV